VSRFKLETAMSYPLYLNQWIGGFAVNLLLKNSPFCLRVSVDTMIGVVLAAGLYWFLEPQLLARRGKWFTLRRGHVLTACAYSMIAVGVICGLSMRA
jgi:peptidoglycan/LPS O-acetylase OafA/YrhL